jgi:NAD(P)-dependent dehydrogenase (short-subunit alcohol dehydrogenase family)
MRERAPNFPAVLIGIVLLSITAVCTAETVLVTGSNSGIGYEFANQYAARGWKVIATHRRAEIPDTLRSLAEKYPNVQIEHMDVTSVPDIDALAAKLKDVPIDILINNAGVILLGPLNDPKTTRGQQFGTLDYSQFDTFMHTNALGPIKIAEAFLPNVKASDHGKIVSISSTGASISPPLTPFREGYWYKASKIALNMMMKDLAFDLQGDGIVVILLHPGGVRSAILKDVKFPSLLDPPESVAAMIKVIDNLTMADTGKFLGYDGQPQPY